MPEIIEHEDGVYLNLPEASYHADPAIGSSALKTLLVEPPEWWWQSRFNTIDPPVVTTSEDEASHFRRGRALHVNLLEGAEVFDRTYGTPPSRESHPEHLDTIPDLQAELRRRNMPVSGNKPDLIARLLAVNPTIPILDAELRSWRALGKREVSAKELRTIKLVSRIAMSEDIDLVTTQGEVTSLRDAFTGAGLSEVSVFWTDENGVRQRCRLDRIKPQVTIDLKSISKWRAKNFRKALLREAVINGNMLQVPHYQEGRRQLRAFVAEGRVFGGSEAQRETLDQIALSDSWVWTFVYAKLGGYPAVKAIPLRDDLAAVLNAASERKQALANFVHYRELWGLEPGRIWLDPEVVWRPDDEDFPAYAGLEP